MKKSAICLALILSTAGIAARAADEPTLEDKRQLLNFLTQGFFDRQPSPGPVRDVPEAEAVPRDVTAAAIKQGLETFLGTFNFWSEEGKRTLIIDSVPAHVPARQLIQAELRWSKAQTGKQAIPLKPAKSTEMVRLEKLEQTQLPDLAAKQIRRLEGTLTVRYPGRIASAELVPSEGDKVKTIAGAACRLLSIRNDLVTVACTGDLGGLEVHPVSAAGVVLDTRSSMTGPTLVHRHLDKRGRLPPALLDKYLADLEQMRGEGSTFVMNAKGKPVKVLVQKPVDFRTETLNVVAHPLPDFGAKQCPAIASPHFAVPVSLPPFVRLGESQVKRGTKLVPERSQAVFGFNDQEIELQLPDVPNSRFAKLQVKDLVLKKKGATVPHELQGPFEDRDSGHVFYVRVEPTEGGKQPVDFDRATGKLAIHYPTRIVTRKLPSPGKPGLAAIDGCEVLRYLGDDLPKDNERRATLRAFDGQGRQLALGHKLTMGGQDDHGAYFAYRFWGQVAWVEVDVVEEWKDITIPFSLKPLPPRPKER